jgi:hypothetical protein
VRERGAAWASNSKTKVGFGIGIGIECFRSRLCDGGCSSSCRATTSTSASRLEQRTKDNNARTPDAEEGRTKQCTQQIQNIANCVPKLLRHLEQRTASGRSLSRDPPPATCSRGLPTNRRGASDHPCGIACAYCGTPRRAWLFERTPDVTGCFGELCRSKWGFCLNSQSLSTRTESPGGGSPLEGMQVLACSVYHLLH